MWLNERPQPDPRQPPIERNYREVRVAQKAHKCTKCRGRIVKGQLYTAVTFEVYHDKVSREFTFHKFCHNCKEIF